MSKNKFKDIGILLAIMAGWFGFLAFSAWTNIRIGNWSVVFWGWEGDLFYIFYENLLNGKMPYIDFFIEYPPLVAYFIAWPWALLGSLVPLSDLDFRGLFVLGVGAWLLLLFWWQYKIYRSLEFSEQKIMTILWFTFLSLAISYSIVFTRFDIFPAMLTLAGLSLYLLYQQTFKWWQLFLAALFVVLAGFLKVYAFVLAPIVIVVELWKKRYWNFAWISVALILVFLVNLPFVFYGYERFAGFLQYQQNRGVQIESLYAGAMFVLGKFGVIETPLNLQNGTNAINTQLAFDLASWAQPITLVFLVALFAFFVWLAWNRKILRNVRLINEFVTIFSIIFVLTFVIFNYIFSPQYLVWLILLIPLVTVVNWTKNQRLAWTLALLTILTSLLTLLIYPLFYEELKNREWWMIIVLNLRNLSLLAIWMGLIYLAFDRAKHLNSLHKND